MCRRQAERATLEVYRDPLPRLKTDRIPAHKLLTMLIRYRNGESRVWSVVHVPSPQADDAAICIVRGSYDRPS